MVDTILPLASLTEAESSTEYQLPVPPLQTSYPMSANPQPSPQQPIPVTNNGNNSITNSSLPITNYSTLWVKLPSEQHPLFGHIQLLLTMFPGPGRMILYCEKEKKRIGTHCVMHEALLAELRELCGEKNVVLK